MLSLSRRPQVQADVGNKRVNQRFQSRLSRQSKESSQSQSFGASYLNVVGQTVDRKSSVCPNSVKNLSKVCPIFGKVQALSSQVQGLSSGCLESVEFLSNSKALGQSLDMEIQDLSRHCLINITPRGNY